MFYSDICLFEYRKNVLQSCHSTTSILFVVLFVDHFFHRLYAIGSLARVRRGIIRCAGDESFSSVGALIALFEQIQVFHTSLQLPHKDVRRPLFVKLLKLVGRALRIMVTIRMSGIPCLDGTSLVLSKNISLAVFLANRPQ